MSTKLTADPIAGFRQKKPGNKYELAWEVERSFTPEIGEWKPRNAARMAVTAICLALALGWYLFVAEQNLARTLANGLIIDGVLIAILLGYRVAKDHVGNARSSTELP